ncbi:hypothetical protein BN1723_001965 [Verticillium longisporum]|uniref:TTI1 N-terminal TPR domain-containing protein n=1 Tax=Verticillium longisporum TaxID=100787 RepID=A0A0G4KV73_VERLO|nr:hypothetical protein BN1723_001965 [Verticillium longisporum]
MANVSPNPARNELFQQLKPCCVSISRIAIDPPKGATAIRQLVELTEELHGIISSQINRDASVIDDKLADYVFFPLSHVFRNQEGYPARLLEAALRCLTAITVHGWKGSISPQIVEQLLILLTFIVGGVPGQNDQHKSPEETTLEALRALTALITAAGTSATAAASLVDAKTIPALGHGVTVVIDSVASGRTPDIQLESLRALQAVFVSIKDHAALATLLPGVVSALAKLLSMPAHEKTRGQVRGKAALLHDVTSVHNVVVPARAGGTREMKTTIAKDISRSSPSSGGGLGRFASAAQTWEAVVRLLIAIVRHVRIEDEIYDGVLALLADRLGHDNDAREALEVVNADAVWFCLYERGAVEILPTPVMEGVTFPDMVQYGSRA